jgi:flavin reductase (DIM6/NTAB) family NADH-FMN oxidoreductase RutF
MASTGVPVFNWLPCPVVFITTAHGGERDIMTATAMFVSEKEPLVQVSVAAGHLTEKLILASGRFTLSIAAEEQAALAQTAGGVKGGEGDKFARLKIALSPAAPAEHLVPEGAAAWMACTVERSQAIPGYRLFIGRVIDQGTLGRAPLVWRDNAYFGLSPV